MSGGLGGCGVSTLGRRVALEDLLKLVHFWCTEYYRARSDIAETMKLEIKDNGNSQQKV